MQKAAKVIPQFLFIFVYCYFKKITVFWITFAFPMIVLSVRGKVKVKGKKKYKKRLFPGGIFHIQFRKSNIFVLSCISFHFFQMHFLLQNLFYLFILHRFNFNCTLFGSKENRPSLEILDLETQPWKKFRNKFIKNIFQSSHKTLLVIFQYWPLFRT